MTFDPIEEYGDDKIVLTSEGVYEGHELEAYCSPDTDGEDYDADGNVVTEKPSNSNHPVHLPTGDWSNSTFGAPFPVDIVFTAKIPNPETVVEIRDQLGQEFNQDFHERCEEVYSIIDEADDPLQEIMDMEPDEVVVSDIPDNA